jgi:outer membrane receptor protein involved in Fe transport
VDFSTQYQFTKNFQGYFEALNLSDAVYHSYGRFSNQTLNLVNYGRSFTVGIRAKF